MDPASIAASAFTLAGGLATCSAAVTHFVRQVKHARKDLDAINTELSATSEILNPLVVSLIGSQGSPLPEAILLSIDTSVRECISIVNRLKADIDHYKRDAVWNKTKWVLFGEKSAQKARENLEMHKLSLGLALQVLSLSNTRQIKQDTELIKGRVEKIHKNMHRIKAQFINICRKQIPRQHQTATEVQRWMEDMSLLSSYAESSYQATVLDRRPSSSTIRQGGTTETSSVIPGLAAEGVAPPAVPQPEVERPNPAPIESHSPTPSHENENSVLPLDVEAQPSVRPETSNPMPVECHPSTHVHGRRSLLYCPPIVIPGERIGMPGPSNNTDGTNTVPRPNIEMEIRRPSYDVELQPAPRPQRASFTLVESYAPGILRKGHDKVPLQELEAPNLCIELEAQDPRIEQDHVPEQGRPSQYAQFLGRFLPHTTPEDNPIPHGGFEPWKSNRCTHSSDESSPSSSTRSASETASSSPDEFYSSLEVAPPHSTSYNLPGQGRAARRVRFNEHVQILPPNNLTSDTQTHPSDGAELYGSLEATCTHPAARSGLSEEDPISYTRCIHAPGSPESPVELSSDSSPILGQGELDIFTKEIFTSEDDIMMKRLVRRDERLTGLSRSRRRELSQEERKLVDGMLLENLAVADKDKFDVCKHLISSGADPNIPQIGTEDTAEAGALMLAVKHSKHRCLTALLRWGARPKTEVLQYAVNIHNNFAVRALIAAGAGVNSGLKTEEYRSYKLIRRTRPVYMRHLSTKRNAEVVKCHRYTLLLGLIAGALTVPNHDALLSQLSCIQFVLSEGADPNWTGSESYSYVSEDATKNMGLSPLHVAVLIWAKFGDIATLGIAKTLLAFGAKPDIFLELGKWPCFVCFGSSPIRMAIKTGNEMLLELLLDHGAADDNYMGISTFQYAVRTNRESMVRTLLRHRDVVRCNYQQDLVTINRHGAKVSESTIRYYQDMLSSLGSYPPITGGEDFPTTIWGGRCGAHPELEEGPSELSSTTSSSTGEDLEGSDSPTGTSPDYVTYDSTSSEFPVAMSEAWLKWAFGDVIQSGQNSAH
ncbi:hypothetical protein QBC45DRAFT_114869 [Copromyces sp. CBS 386.78]|nr:hypothetical protein QBC45DRAFT_114869 [Copromyces sp. CBS 386.78]